MVDLCVLLLKNFEFCKLELKPLSYGHCTATAQS